METFKLNTIYDLEYYKGKSNEYYNKYAETQRELNKMQDKIIEVQYKMIEVQEMNIILIETLKDFENQRACTVKLQISK